LYLYFVIQEHDALLTTETEHDWHHSKQTEVDEDFHESHKLPQSQTVIEKRADWHSDVTTHLVCVEIPLVEDTPIDDNNM